MMQACANAGTEKCTHAPPVCQFTFAVPIEVPLRCASRRSSSFGWFVDVKPENHSHRPSLCCGYNPDADIVSLTARGRTPRARHSLLAVCGDGSAHSDAPGARTSSVTNSITLSLTCTATGLGHPPEAQG